MLQVLHFLTLLDNLTETDMNNKSHLLPRLSSKLGGIANVLEVLESSFRHSVSAMLEDLNQLQENILKTKQVKMLIALDYLVNSA